jgi:cytochrome P450
VFWYLTPSDRANRANIFKLRDLFLGVIQRRRAALISDPSAPAKNDLLSILLSDDLFKNNDKMVVDECLTFFFAATQTSSMTTQNMFVYLI